MANLLDLVDALIGNVLNGNIYTDTAPFVGMSPQRPDNIPAPNTDPRNLNFNSGDPHPHTDSKVIPGPTSTPPALMHSPPLPTRESMYQFGNPPSDIVKQTNDSRTLLNPRIPRDQMYNPGPPPPDVSTGQRSIMEANPSLAKGQSFDPTNRENIYKKDFDNGPGRSKSNASEIVSNIGGAPNSNPTQGDLKALAGLPPASSLNSINRDSPRSNFAPIQGSITSDFDAAHRLGNVYDDNGLNPNPFAERGGRYAMLNGPGSSLTRHIDIYAIAHWLRNIGKEFGLFPIQDNNDQNKMQRPAEMITKGITWAASQFLLTSLNKGDPQAYGLGNLSWNPLSLLTNAIPFRADLPGQRVTIGANLTNYEDNLSISVAASQGGFAPPGVGERLLLMRQGMYSEAAPVHRLTKGKSPVAVPGFVGDLAKAGKTDTLEDERVNILQGVTVTAQVDGGLATDFAAKLGLHTNPYSAERPYAGSKAGKDSAIYTQSDALLDAQDGKDVGVEKLKTLFDPRGFPGGPTTDFNPTSYTFVAKPQGLIVGFTGEEMADSPGINPATTEALLPGEDPIEAVALNTEIPEGNLYMPFMFQDLRNSTQEFLYFRAFLKNDISENFTPEWQAEKYYGRVDKIPVYTGTDRTISFSFDIVTWSPADLPIVWKKIEKLQSMVYPSYNTQGFMQAGPIVRMRIGDLFAGEGKRGLPGYINTMGLTYDDGIWNIQEDLKVPRVITVSISFTVLHDGNPGIYPFKSADIAPDGGVVAVEGKTFGAGKMQTQPDGVTNVNVSRAEIRKIFDTVRKS